MNLYIILGQTCSGKTAFSLELARKLGNSWIVNCDSRQVYASLDIGTAKVAGIWKDGVYWVQDIPHFLIDFVSPSQKYNLANYVLDFIDIFQSPKLHLPQNVILVGGTGLYAKTIFEEMDLGLVHPQFEIAFEDLKKNLNALGKLELQERLLELVDVFVDDKEAFDLIDSSQKKKLNLNHSDWNNPRRLISHIMRTISRVNNWKKNIDYLVFENKYYWALEINQIEMEKRINQRILERVEQGLLAEVQSLFYLGENRLDELGLEYRLTKDYLNQKMSYEQWITNLQIKNRQYAKQQLTWLQKQPVDWVKGVE